MSRPLGHTLGLVAVVSLLVCVFPQLARAHGPVAPVASDYLARATTFPSGLEVKVVDGDQRMWLRVPSGQTVIVLDYRGAPYLRFSSRGVEVNGNSSMYYLNQTPVAETPPRSLTATTPPSWHRVTGSHQYDWHDGRLHALATIALAPGTSYVGRWTIPVVTDGRLSSIGGGLWHAGSPSIVWFWPIVVLLACVLAAWRMRRPRLDATLVRALASAALLATAVAAIGRELHGRPTTSLLQLVELAVILAFVAWGLVRVLLGEPRYFFLFAVAFVALWEGAVLIATLLNGFVLVAEPAFLARAATVLCLGCGAALLLFTFRFVDRPKDSVGPARDGTDPLHDEETILEGV